MTVQASESDVTLLGGVPPRWTVGRLSRWYKVTLGKMLDEAKFATTHGEMLPYVRAANIQPAGLDLSNVKEMPFTSSEQKRLDIRAGDLLVVEGGSVGVNAYVDDDMEGWGFQKTVNRVRARAGASTRFLGYLLDAMRGAGVLELVANASTIRHLTAEKLERLIIAMPDDQLQTSIAHFLDRETVQVDEFIANTEELIELLIERRAAVIFRGVTKGLDPTALLKPSGVEWLGDVPEHWRIQRLATTVKTARNGLWGDEPDGENDIRCVRVADFDRAVQRIQDNDVTLRAISARERRGRVLEKGNLLLEKSGGGEKSPVGFVVMYDRKEPAVCSNFVARVVLADDMEPCFWTYVHGAMYRLRITQRSLKQSTGIQNLDQRSYFNELAAVPPQAEQLAIADHLDAATARIDDAVAVAEQGIALARERHATLISAAVTGKHDVRDET